MRPRRLARFPEAINAIFPQIEVQLCVIQQIGNYLKYVARKNQKEFMADLKPAYKVEAIEGAVTALDDLEEKWTMPLQNWNLTLPQFLIYFESRKTAFWTPKLSMWHKYALIRPSLPCLYRWPHNYLRAAYRLHSAIGYSRNSQGDSAQ